MIQKAVNAFKNEYEDSFADAQVSTARLATRLIMLGTSTLPALGETANRTAQGLNKAFSNIARNFREFGVIKSFHNILKNMPNITKNWTQAIGNFGGAFLNIMGQAMPFARRMARAIKDISRDFLAWSDSRKGREQIHRFFKSAAPVAKALWQQISRIGGALLRWTTQSKKGPERVAAAIKTVGDVVMGTVHLIRRMINLWRAIPKPIQGVIIKVALLWAGLRILFGSVILKGLAKLGWKIAALGVSFVKARVGMAGLRMGIARFTVWAGLAWGRMWMALQGITALGVRGILLRLGPIGLAIGAISWYMVNVFNRAYKSITETTPTFANNLVRMHENGAINSSQMWVSAFRFAAAETYKIMVGALNDIKFKLADILGKIPGMGGITEQWKNDVNEDMNQTYRAIAGKTALSAKEMKENTKDGTSKSSKAMEAWKQDTNNTLNRTASNTKDDLFAMKNAMIKQTQEGQKKGVGNMKDFQAGGTGQMKDLFKNVDYNMGKMKGSSNDNTEKMMNTGIDNFKDFNFGGRKNTEELQTKAIMHMADMQSKVNKYTNDTQHKGVQDLEDLRAGGNKAWEGSKKDWVTKAFGTSSMTQDAFNSMISGIAKFIEALKIDMDKPKEFTKTTPTGGRSGMSDKYGFAKGGVAKFAAGGEHGPVGGVAEGTTRVYGEVPGTTEFYITDNKKYRDRNLDILAAANEHMLMAKGGRYPPKAAAYRNTGRDGTVDYGASRGAGGAARGAARMWKGLVEPGGRDADVIRSRRSLGGNKGAFASTAGKIVLGPRADKYHAAHEFGHLLGLGHGGNGIMGGRGRDIGGPSRGDFAAIKAYYGGSGGGRGGRGGKRPDEVSPSDSKKERREDRREAAKTGRQERRAARAFRRRFNSNKENFGPMGETPDYSRNALWYAVGGTHKPRGMKKSTADFLLDQASERMSTVHEARGGLYPSRPVPTRGGEYRNLGGTTYNWKEPAKSIQEATKKAVSGITTNTYVGHPGGEGNSVDHWGPGGRGANIGSSKGNAVESYILANWKKQMEYYIWQGTIHGWGGSKPYSDKSDQHFDHLHATYPGGTPNLGGAKGGSSGPSAEEVRKAYDKYVPVMTANGYGRGTEGVNVSGNRIRETYFEKALANASTSDGEFTGKSPKGLTLGEAVKQGGWPSSQYRTAIGVAWEESGANASAQNPSGARGLFQMMPVAARDVGMSYDKMKDPIYNSTAAAKLHGKHGWSPWVAYPPSSSSMARENTKITGYSHGGVVTRPHMGMIGDTGPEVNLPLHDPRALAMMRRAFDMSDRVSSGAMHRNKAISEAIGSGQRIDQGTGSQRDGSIEQALNKATKRADDAIERAIDKMGDRLDNRVKELIKTEMDLSDANAEKFMRAGMKMMMEILQHPHVGGDIVNEHIARDVDFETELKKR